MTAQTATFDAIDWNHDYWLVRFWRIGLARFDKSFWSLSLCRCQPCGGRLTLSVCVGRYFLTANCRKARGLVAPPRPKEEFPEFTDDLDFFDAHNTIEANF